MRFLSRLHSAECQAMDDLGGSNQTGGVCYESVVRANSKVLPGVSYTINRISFGRRMELTRRVREISQRVEFLEAGSDLKDKIEANILAQEIEAMYLRWALVAVDGLTIDSKPACIEQLLERGPDELTREIVGAIKAQCGLSETERKN
jgi:hypothetical protein